MGIYEAFSGRKNVTPGLQQETLGRHAALRRALVQRPHRRLPAARQARLLSRSSSSSSTACPSRRCHDRSLALAQASGPSPRLLRPPATSSSTSCTTARRRTPAPSAPSATTRCRRASTAATTAARTCASARRITSLPLDVLDMHRRKLKRESLIVNSFAYLGLALGLALFLGMVAINVLYLDKAFWFFLAGDGRLPRRQPAARRHHRRRHRRRDRLSLRQQAPGRGLGRARLQPGDRAPGVARRLLL